MTAPSWRDRAACLGQDPERFYSHHETTQAEARQLCRGCPVKTECLDEALRMREQGYWGGTSDRQREAIRRRQQRQQGKAAA